jgi:uncharacterized protein (DUF2164 family)
MEKLEFTSVEKDQIVHKVKTYFRDELDQEIGGFDAEFLIDFFSAQIGTYFYNRGLQDAHQLFTQKVEEFGDSIYEIEQPTEFRK